MNGLRITALSDEGEKVLHKHFKKMSFIQKRVIKQLFNISFVKDNVFVMKTKNNPLNQSLHYKDFSNKIKESLLDEGLTNKDFKIEEIK